MCDERHPSPRFAAGAWSRVLGAGTIGALLGGPQPSPAQSGAIDLQHARLVARSVLPAATYRPGLPSSGAFLDAAERATAAANGIVSPERGPYFAAQPVQGFSSMVPAAAGNWWALADNGYAWRHNSADWQLVIYRIDPRWGAAAPTTSRATSGRVCPTSWSLRRSEPVPSKGDGSRRAEPRRRG